MQFPRVEIGLVDVRDFQFAPGGGLDFTCNIHDVLIIKIKPGHGVAGFGMLGFLLEGADFHILIELDHAVTLGIADVIPEDGRALFLLPGADEEIFEAVAEENIVPKDQAGVASLDEVSGKEERLSDTFRLRLCDVLKGASPLAAVPEKFAELPAVVWRGDDGNLTDARQKENRQRIIDHRLIVDRQQLLADAEREGVKPRTGTARQQDTFP